jgi:hypothetical protein
VLFFTPLFPSFPKKLLLPSAIALSLINVSPILNLSRHLRSKSLIYGQFELVTKMAENLEGSGLMNNGDGWTYKFITSVIENSFFAVTYALQFKVNEVRLYRKNYFWTFVQTLMDYLHIIPFLVHRESFLNEGLEVDSPIC